MFSYPARISVSSITVCLLLGGVCLADVIVPFSTTNSKEFLIISKSIKDTGTTAISLTTTGNTLGHVVNLAQSAPGLPNSAITGLPVPSPETVNPTYDGDVALLDNRGRLNYQDPNVFGDPDQGIVGKAGTGTVPTLSNTQFDNGVGGLQNWAVNRGLEQFAPAGSATTTRNVNTFANEINNARTALMTMESNTANVNIPTSSGLIDSDTFITLPNPGLNIVKFSSVGSNDISINNANLVIEAPIGATPGDRQAIVYVPDDSNLLTSNGNILIGANMGLMDVVFVSTKDDDNAHFSFSNTVLNGVAFWDMRNEVEDSSDKSPEHNWNNVTGCTQLIGDKINLSSEIHLSNCGFRGISAVPEPSAFACVALVAGASWCVQRNKARRQKRAS